MLRFSHRTLILISGGVWLAVGAWLMPLGLSFLSKASKELTESPLLSWLSPMVGGVDNATIAVLTVALLIGYVKGRKVLGKSAEKGSKRILTLPNPAPLSKIYPPAYYILLGGMVALGMSMKWFGFPLDVRGLVDVAVGSALINGAMIYFKNAFLIKSRETEACCEKAKLCDKASHD